ncbi:MAG: hypothetical protein PUC10_06780, partial [Clostridiales bacterium]|nr:hypothetical protein [Clostridiales bacterium]
YRMSETVYPLKDVNMSVNDGKFIAVEDLLAEEAAKKGAGVVMVTRNSRWTAAAALKYKMQNGELIKI